MKIPDCFPPAVETLLEPNDVDQNWLKNNAESDAFLNQLRARALLNERLDTVITRVPKANMSLQEAIQQKFITEEQGADLYESLSDLLEDFEYQRMVLYLPFEFLPEATWRPDSDLLQIQMERFKVAYMEAWENQLFIHDVRSNFVDGEATEEEVRDGTMVRVVKAAHLIPKLVEVGWMKAEDGIIRMEKSEDETLRSSLAEALLVLADLGFIGAKERARMKNSTDWFVRSMERELDYPPRNNGQAVHNIPKIKTFEIFQQTLGQELAAIEAVKYKNMGESRAKWLKSDTKRRAIEAAGDAVCSAILEEGATGRMRIDFLSAEAIPASQQALVDGIRKAIEAAMRSAPEEAQTLYERYADTLVAFWGQNIPEVRDALRKAFFRLNSVGIAPNEQLAELGMARPKLAGPFSKNLGRMEEEMQAIKKAIDSIESDSELSKYIYPATLVFGSKLKGYSSSSSDIDTGVFVKPGTNYQERAKLKELLREAFIHEGVPMEVKQFWLEEKGDSLAVHDFEDGDLCCGESHWTHVLFGAAWVGKKDRVNELQRRLLMPYFHETDKRFYDHVARRFYLEAIERDTLLFRLAHRGYAHFYAPCGGMNTPHSDQIDGNTAFWDSGYRQVATKLFASRVFLPKLPRVED